MISEMHGFNTDREKYRFIVDTEQQKVRLFKKAGDKLVPLTVWSFQQLVNEMLSIED
jgi:hypothetical protein